MTSRHYHSRVAAFHLVDVVFERLWLLVELSLLGQCTLQDTVLVPRFALKQTAKATGSKTRHGVLEKTVSNLVVRGRQVEGKNCTHKDTSKVVLRIGSSGRMC
jgi:hypothetical protein